MDCYKSFTTAGNLKNHMRIHTGKASSAHSLGHVDLRQVLICFFYLQENVRLSVTLKIVGNALLNFLVLESIVLYTRVLFFYYSLG